MYIRLWIPALEVERIKSLHFKGDGGRINYADPKETARQAMIETNVGG